MIKFLIRSQTLVLLSGLVIGFLLALLSFYVISWDFSKPYFAITGFIIVLACFVGSAVLMIHLQTDKKYQDIRCEIGDHASPKELDSIEEFSPGRYLVKGRCPRCGKKIKTVLERRFRWEEDEKGN